MLNKERLIFILKYWLLSRFIIFIIAFITINYFSFKPTYPYWQSDLRPLASRHLWTWAAFDGAHYLRIAKTGYNDAFTQVFFPGYPLLISLLNPIFNNYLLSGLLIANLSFIVFLLALYSLLLRNWPEKLVKKTLKIYLFFPTTFFFNSLYTESLFMCLTVLFFNFLDQKHWFKASIMASFASFTRVVGIFLGVVLFFECFIKKRYRSAKGVIFSVISILGFLCYLTFLKINFNNYWLFIKSMSLWEKNKFIFLPQTFWRYSKMLLKFNIGWEIYYIILLELSVACIFLYLLIKSYRKIKRSYFIFCCGCLLLPLSTGTFSSLPRYVLPLFPLFMILAELLNKNKRLNFIYWGFSCTLLVINVFLFVSGKFVS